jgi:hypothetical protein
MIGQDIPYKVEQTQVPHRRVPSAPAEFRRHWILVTLSGAGMLTVIDALLLQRARSFFTGGFLSVDHLDGPWAITGFLVTSLLADASIIGVIAAVVMWVFARSRIRTGALLTAALLASVGPLIVADGISYELLRYLGDAADLSLMLDLAGGSVSELLAVASTHLVVPLSLAATAAMAAGALVWAIHRYTAGEPPPPPAVRALTIPALVCVAGLLVTTAVSASSDVMENGLRRKPAGRIIGFIADEMTDLDGDGFGVAARVSDPDPFDVSVFPYGVDQPGNGIDEDGIGGDLPTSTPAYTEGPIDSTPWIRRPDVVLIVLESFRADVVGAHHEGRPITPVLDALARRGVSSAHAYSHNGYTAQSRFHLLSGSLAGVGDQRTLIDDFKANGYTTAYFSGQDESFGAAEYRVGFDRADVAYDARVEPERRYSTFTTPGSLAVPLTVVQERIRGFLQAADHRDRPLFLYVNFHDTHFPYSHDHVDTLVSRERLPRRAIAPQAREALWATYVNTAANVDRAIGGVLADVRHARGGDPAVIVTADHGESLFDEGFLGHGYALNEVQTRVPFIAANLPLVIDEPFGQSDLRKALGAALRGSAGGPRSEASQDRRVFQYLGTLRRPRQIAFLQADGRTIYDFRSGRVQFRDGVWRRVPELGPAYREQFLSLIHEWERMVVARRDRLPGR